MDTEGMRSLRIELSRYLEEMYLEAAETGQSGSGCLDPAQSIKETDPSAAHPTGREKASLTSGQAKDLDEMMNDLGKSFHQVLFERIEASGLTDAEVYKRANLDRKLFSKIRTNPAYHPRKGTVLALAVALHFDIKDTEDLLSRAGYALSPGSKADLIVKFFIEHKVYDIDAINYTLDEYELPLLSGG